MQSEFMSMTLGEIYDEVKCGMAKHFKWKDTTKKEYETNYQKLSEYLNNKPFFEYDLNDFETALTAIKNSGYYTNNHTVYHSYSEDKIKTFNSNLRSLYKYLEYKGVCKCSLFWGTKSKIKDTLKVEDNLVIENVRLKKSLKPLAEKKCI